MPALAPGDTVLLKFVENRPPSSGTRVYRPVSTVMFADANERNHRPTRSVSFYLAATLGGRGDTASVDGIVVLVSVASAAIAAGGPPALTLRGARDV